MWNWINNWMIHFRRENTPPGTKIRLVGKVPVVQGFLLLDKSNTEVLGGRVEKMIESWNLKKVKKKKMKWKMLFCRCMVLRETWLFISVDGKFREDAEKGRRLPPSFCAFQPQKEFAIKTSTVIWWGCLETIYKHCFA